MTSDVYGRSAIYHGTVAGIAAGTGAAFALLPPQNAAGNWIKVVQRVPVRIVLDPQELVTHPLRVGLSMEVNVDTASPAADVPPAPPADTNVYTLDASRVDAEADAIIAANLRGAS
jgi:membrane fusion protein (multidrug efflux system)